MHRLDTNASELYELGWKLFTHPELGYKEYTNKKILSDYFLRHGLKIEELGFNTAFKVSIGQGHPHLGLIAELDALPTPGHPFANKKDSSAAHSCGHFSQCAIMAYALVNLKDTLKKGRVTLYFTPAEEFVDIAYRKKLIKEKKINYIGGKVNMLCASQFDDEDLFIHLHTMGEGKYHFSLNSLLGGFIYKEITFKGKASHAAVSPHKGINALNEFVLFDNALNMLRETFREQDHIRVHGRIVSGGESVNSIAEKVVYECYVRAHDQDVLKDLSLKIDNIAKYTAKAIGGNALVRSIPGYLPLRQNRMINDIIRKNMLKYCDADDIRDGEISMAAGDIGDLSLFKPTVQFGYSGFKGSCHSKYLCVEDENRAYLEPAKIVYDTIKYLSEHEAYVDKIIADFKPAMSKNEYLNYLKGK